jgi:hypothetical protein
MNDKSRTFRNLRRPERTLDKDLATVASAIQRIATFPEGVVFLDWMRNRTTFRVVGPDASDGALRAAEGNRQLMLEIESMISSGGRNPTEP